MYKHQITIELDDELVHKYSILEWEEIFLRNSVIQRDELPLSYGRIAEVLAEEYHKYGQPYFFSEYGAAPEIKETTVTTFTNKNGFTTNTRMLPAKPELFLPEEDPVGTMQIGISRYGKG